MGGNKVKGRILILVLFLFSFSFLFSQTEEALSVLEANKNSVIFLIVFGPNKDIIAEGSAFVIENGVVATSYQLISQAQSAEGRDYRGKKVKIDGVLAFDKNLNVALLKIKRNIQAVNLGNSDGLDKEKKVFALGSNELGNIVVSEGVVSNFIELPTGQRAISTSLSIPERFSGGPLLDINRQVMGVVIFFESGLKYVLPSNLLRTLKRKGIVKLKNWRQEDYLSSFEGAYLAGRIAALRDQTSYAQKYLERVVRQKPDNIDAQALLASVYSRQRNYQSAITAYKKVIELDENRDDAHYGLGAVYIKMRRFSESIPSLEKAVQLNLDNKEAYYLVGNAYEELKDLAKAAEAYENFLNLNPDNPWRGNMRLGLVRKELGQFEAAIVALEEALKEKPQDIRINYNLAQACQEAGQLEKAEEVYKFLAKLTPNDAVAYHKNILMMYDKAGMNEKAIDAAKKVIEMDPQSEVNIYNLGIMYMKLERYDEAIETFNNALTVNPDYESAFYNIGFCYSKQKKYNESIEAFKKFVELSPDNADGWFNVGIGYMLLKQFESALEPLQRTVELSPENSAALYNLAITYLNLQDRISAREIQGRLETLNPELARKLERLLR